MARTRQHIVETLSRRIVTSLLPAEHFVERDQTERDYGIDLSVECFDAGEPSGAILLLQLKGTDDPQPSDDAKTIPFDMRVKDLKRVERFTTPVLLIWCPVNATPARFYYLWLQSYTREILDHEKPDWRNQVTIRLQIPVDNIVPGDAERTLFKLKHIAGHPARVEQFGQLARLTYEAPFIWDDPSQLIQIMEQCLKLDAIFGDPKWHWARYHRAIIERGLRACEIALRGIDPTSEELRELGWALAIDHISSLLDAEPEADLTVDIRREHVAYTAQNSVRILMAMVAMYFDHRLRNTLWTSNGDHDF